MFSHRIRLPQLVSLLIQEGMSLVEVAHQTGHAPTMTLATDAHVFDYELRDGLVVRDRPFTSRNQALEAVGLRE